MKLSPLLLSDPSPCLRWLVLRRLFGFDADHLEVQELEDLRQSDPLLLSMLELQAADGSWVQRHPDELPGVASRVVATGFMLARMGYLGFDRTHPAVQRAAEYLFSQQQADGSWSLPQEADLSDGEQAPPNQGEQWMMPLQTALPLRGLAACGYGKDARSELAYEWLLARRLPDGAWPTGIAAGVYRYVGGYRKLAHSRWGCRSNTTAALICLAHHPERRRSDAARRALDLLLGRETRDEASLGFETARLVGAEQTRGYLTFFARYDLAQVLWLCSRVGASTDDERVAGMLEFILGQQGPYGLWEYPSRPQVRRWLTFDILSSLTQLDERSDWLSLEPRTPFRAYASRRKRF